MRHPSIFAAAVLILAAPLGAQQAANRSWSVSVGQMGYDASGTGTATVFGLSAVQTMPWRWFAVEGAAGFAGIDEQFSGPKTQLGMAEVQAQLQWPARLIRPYIGVGGGLVSYLTNAGGRKSVEPSGVVSAGLRAAITDVWGLRLDGRVRGWEFGNTDFAANSTAELSLGISRRF